MCAVDHSILLLLNSHYYDIYWNTVQLFGPLSWNNSFSTESIWWLICVLMVSASHNLVKSIHLLLGRTFLWKSPTGGKCVMPAFRCLFIDLLVVEVTWYVVVQHQQGNGVISYFYLVSRKVMKPQENWVCHLPTYWQSLLWVLESNKSTPSTAQSCYKNHM